MALLYDAIKAVPHDTPHSLVSSDAAVNKFSITRDESSVVMTANTYLGVLSEPVRLFINSLSKTVEDMKSDANAAVEVSFRHLDNHKTLEVTVSETPGRREAGGPGAPAARSYSRSSFYSNINGVQSFGESLSKPSVAYSAAEVAAALRKQLRMHSRDKFNVVARVETPEKHFLDEAESGFLLSAALLNPMDRAVLRVHGQRTPKELFWKAADVRMLLQEADPTKSLREE